MFKKIFILIFLSLVLILPSSSHALNTNQSSSSAKLKISYENVNPKDGFKFSFKRFQEKLKLTLFFYSTKSKYNYEKDLLNRRLAELKYVVDNKDISNIQTTSQRYYTQAGNLTQFVLKNNLDKKDLEGLLNKHLTSIREFKRQYNDNTAEWRFINHDEGYINIYISQLN